MKRIASIALLGCLLVSGCVVYEPVPGYYTQSTYDRAWNAALGAMQDAGVQMTAAEPSTGSIRGTKDGMDVSAFVVRQADARVRVQFDVKGPAGRDPG